MKLFLRLLALLHGAIAIVLALAAVALMVVAIRTGWPAIAGGLGAESAMTILEAIGVAAIAIVSLQIAQTITEEEVIREANVSAPTRVRRFLSRFLVVVVVAMAIEGLIATFKALREDTSGLYYAAAIVSAVGILLAGWGVFIRFNREAEELEPEAMEQAKQEDAKLE
jgi:hypothetical protein